MKYFPSGRVMTNTRVEFIIFADRTHLDEKRQSTPTLPDFATEKLSQLVNEEKG
jgi:hypothetical protein